MPRSRGLIATILILVASVAAAAQPAYFCRSAAFENGDTPATTAFTPGYTTINTTAGNPIEIFDDANEWAITSGVMRFTWSPTAFGRAGTTQRFEICTLLSYSVNAVSTIALQWWKGGAGSPSGPAPYYHTRTGTNGVIHSWCFDEEVTDGDTLDLKIYSPSASATYTNTEFFISFKQRTCSAVY